LRVLVGQRWGTDRGTGGSRSRAGSRGRGQSWGRAEAMMEWVWYWCGVLRIVMYALLIVAVLGTEQAEEG
jgi:hypothetical protein